MAIFFIDTATGQVTTRGRLVETGVMSANDDPPAPWYRIRATDDATTLWYAVMRRQEKGIFIGTLTLRHGDHHALLLERGWEEVDVDEMRDFAP
jgi:hypothetical protein